MGTITTSARSRVANLMIVIPAALLVLTNCFGIEIALHSTVDLAAFKALARTGGCADIRNRLFLIDDQLVFWDRAGRCADASYSQTLHGSTPDQVLCVSHDSIAGPIKKCSDARYQNMFATLTTHLSMPDLGLGAEHTVQPIPF